MKRSEPIVAKNPLRLPVNTMFDEIVVWFTYTFIKPFQHFHRRFKIGEMVEYNSKSVNTGISGCYPQLAIVVSAPKDRVDRRRKWLKPRKIKKCLYELYLIESQLNHTCHFTFIKRIK